MSAKRRVGADLSQYDARIAAALAGFARDPGYAIAIIQAANRVEISTRAGRLAHRPKETATQH